MVADYTYDDKPLFFAKEQADYILGTKTGFRKFYSDSMQHRNYVKFSILNILVINIKGNKTWSLSENIFCLLKFEEYDKKCIRNSFGDEISLVTTGKIFKSYVIGYGKSYPLTPHHRASSCPPQPKGFDSHNSQGLVPSQSAMIKHFDNQRGVMF